MSIISSNSGAQSIVQTPTRQKSFISSAGSYNYSQKQQNDLAQQLSANAESEPQIIGEKPQEEEETVERGKEGKKDSHET